MHCCWFVRSCATPRGHKVPQGYKVSGKSRRHSPRPITPRKSASRLQPVAFHLCVNDEAHALGNCEVNSSHRLPCPLSEQLQWSRRRRARNQNPRPPPIDLCPMRTWINERKSLLTAVQPSALVRKDYSAKWIATAKCPQWTGDRSV